MLGGADKDGLSFRDAPIQKTAHDKLRYLFGPLDNLAAGFGTVSGHWLSVRDRTIPSQMEIQRPLGLSACCYLQAPVTLRAGVATFQTPPTRIYTVVSFQTPPTLIQNLVEDAGGAPCGASRVKNMISTSYLTELASILFQLSLNLALRFFLNHRLIQHESWHLLVVSIDWLAL